MSLSHAEHRSLVSVITPIYNCEKYLDEAVESVFAQTHNHWELLLIDDGSTDASPGIARRYAERYPQKVQYLEHPSHQNRGASASRNVGIRQARGEYLTFLDADDILLPRKLESQVAILRTHPEAAMTYGPGQWWYSWTGSPEDIGRDFTQKLKIEPDTLVRPPSLLTHFIRNGSATPLTSALLVRRDVVERVGGFEDSFRGAYDDQVLYAKLSLAESIFVEKDCHCRYRKHASSLCAVMKQEGTQSIARLKFLSWLEGYLAGRGITDGEVWSLVQAQLWPHRHPRLHHCARRVRRVRASLKQRLKLFVPAPARRWLRDQWCGRVGA
jgi:glycosyltransferase involved in cell wall biosynthesis